MTHPVLVASRIVSDADAIVAALGGDACARAVSHASLMTEVTAQTPALVMDANLTAENGIDALMAVLSRFHLPILMITPPGDARYAVEALDCGASAYVVKEDGYVDVVAIAVRDLLARADQEASLKRTITYLRRRLQDAEDRLAGKKNASAPDERAEQPEDRRARLLADVKWRLSSGQVTLPAYPKVASRLRAMAKKADVSMREVADLLSQDPAISVKLLALAKSPLYGASGTHSTVQQAIKRLGMATTCSVVDMLANRSLYLTSSKAWMPMYETVWQHGLASAWAGRLLAEQLGLRTAEDVFGMGLLHQAGKLMLLQVLAELVPGGEFLASQEGRDFIQQFIDTNHGQYGAALLQRWKFSRGYQDAALFAECPEQLESFSKELLVVHLAARVASMTDVESGVEALQEDAAARYLGLDREALATVYANATAAVDECQRTLGGAPRKPSLKVAA